LLGTIIVGGCGVGVGPDREDGSRSTLNLATLGLDSETTYYETSPNHLFELAEFVVVVDQPRVIRGNISGGNDVDVYDLGPVAPGDRVVVTMTAAESLDAAIAIFDGNGTSLLVNDHRNVYLGRTEPFVDVIINQASDACYIAASSTPGFASSGDYALIASKTFAARLPDPKPDVVLLVFDGGQHVRIGTRSAVDVPVFDAASISSVYAGQTRSMSDEIVYRVREDYLGLDVAILSTSEGDVFEPDMTRVFFGTYDSALLGVAEGVDEFNATNSQEAIVFTNTFSAFMRLEPSVEQLGQAIANVASHEIGHLLGIVHTEDPSGLMDVTASLSALTRNQAFRRSPIYSAVFPLGFQDALQYLLGAIGGDEMLLFSKAFSPAAREAHSSGDGDQRPARASLRLSSCCLVGH
jgi:hypothetical protein